MKLQLRLQLGDDILPKWEIFLFQINDQYMVLCSPAGRIIYPDNKMAEAETARFTKLLVPHLGTLFFLSLPIKDP